MAEAGQPMLELVRRRNTQEAQSFMMMFPVELQVGYTATETIKSKLQLE